MKIIFIILCLFLFSSPVFAEGKVSINEFSPHPTTGEKEWIELYNPESISLQGYVIDDDTSFQEDNGNSSKKSLETVSGSLYSVIELSSMFNNSGDNIVLFDTHGMIVDQFTYMEDAGLNISIGRSPDGTGAFGPLASATKGSVNSGPQLAPTETPTPTSKPTPPPKPSPTPKKSPTPQKEPTLTKAASSLLSYEEGTTSPAKVLKQIGKDKPVATNGAYPTAVLGTSSASKKVVTKKPVLVKGETSPEQFPFLQIVLSVVGLILCACGIIFFVKIRRRRSN